jgi:uncharacterized protein involved in exopolysaccharide biosynthesis
MLFKHKTFIGLAIIAFIFLTVTASFAETVNYNYDDTGQLRQRRQKPGN